MPSCAWNDLEDEALRRVPWRARVIYLQGIRRHMDYRTGWAGIRRVLSYRFFTELLECSETSTAPDPAVTKDGLRAIFRMLERAGLVEWPRGAPAQRGVVFRCLLADVDKSAQKQDAPKTHPRRTHQDAPIKRRSDAGLAGEDAPKTHPCCSSEDAPPPITGKEKTKRCVNTSVELAQKPLPENLPVRAVFLHWQDVCGHPRARLDTKRERAIAARLADGYSVADLKAAVDGCLASPWHQGKNDRRAVFDDIELICRDGPKVDRFIAMTRAASRATADLDDWLNEDRTISGVCSHV